MKKILVMFVILSIILVGCSPGKDSFIKGPGREYGERPDFAQRPMQMDEEQRQKMFEETQQKSLDACAGKNEEDQCQIEGFRGSINGTCQFKENDLICFFERPMRPGMDRPGRAMPNE
ncbi:hypothetical protein JW851_00840 [Candidatus Woesearchaeota archaeon]|nr:hypothetical protein [Candidatus Woesearchaeota archaeon]